MTDEEIKSKIDELINDDGAISIPGLTADEIIPNLVDKKHANELSAIPNDKDREDKRKELIDYYKTGYGREMVDSEINNIKLSFSAIKSQMESIKQSAITTASQMAVPAVLTVGSASSAPNPAYVSLDAKAKRNSLLSILKTAAVYAASLLISSQKLGFSIPQEVVAVISLISTTKKTVKTLG